MASIHFTFGESVAADERERVLEEIRSWNGIASASQLKPASRHPVTARLAYAMVENEDDLPALVERISEIPCIETADVPARRGIAK
jgi:hypothetical protein